MIKGRIANHIHVGSKDNLCSIHPLASNTFASFNNCCNFDLKLTKSAAGHFAN